MIKINEEEKERIKRLLKEECAEENIEKYVNKLVKILKEVDEEKVKTAVRRLKAVSSFNRLKTLILLEKKEMCVCEITVLLGVTQPTATHHLQILEEAQLISGETRGKWRYYRPTKMGKKLINFINQIT